LYPRACDINPMTKELAAATHFSAADLHDRLKGCRIVKDAAYKDLTVEHLLCQASRASLVSKSFRREVYFLDAPVGKFFLKISPLSHKKDRRRFLMLPWRIGTEWRNLYRLEKKSVAAPKRVFFGYKGRYPCRGFFLVTEDVGGTGIDCRNPGHMFRLADYLAVLHAKGVYHRDLHPGNILIDRSGQPVLLDAQEVYFFPWLPHGLRLRNLGRLWRYIHFLYSSTVDLDAFLAVYNSGRKTAVAAADVMAFAVRFQEQYYASRAKRCFKNSSEFKVVKNGRGVKGFERRDFQWGKDDLQAALSHGEYIKDEKLIAYGDVCIKIHDKRFFHKNRCLKCWQMARALAVRGVNGPKALAYYAAGGCAYFLMVYYRDSIKLNAYLSALYDQGQRRAAIRRLADWVRTCHDLNIWQRDFKSSNVLVLAEQFMMVDLEGVRLCRRLSWRRRVFNLAQLNASVSHALTIKDRLRFFYFYCRGRLPSVKKRRKAYQRIWRIAQKKNTLPFGLDLERLSL